ncbi:30S ribosomal protein S5 [Candidatus Saccharibacteria bacterium]|nr:30S ribosomal protein S5 [Candidatus Saccharibacteria bacterium]
MAATRQIRDISGRRMNRNNRRDRVRANDAPKEFDETTIHIYRVSRTVAGGRRMRFKALVAVGNHKNKIGVAVAKGNDVTSAVQKATTKAKKNMVTFHMDGETLCHEVEVKITGANVLMKPAAPGTGIIAGGVVRSIIGLTGVKNLISKSLGSTNKVNIAYAVLEGLRQQTPRKEWTTTALKGSEPKVEKDAPKAEKKAETKAAPKAEKAVEKKVAAKPAAKAAKAPAKKATATKKAAPKKPAAKKAAAKKEK